MSSKTEGLVCIITPVKNEEKNLPLLIESVSSQDQQPDIWVIVDDNSTDSSGEIIKNVEKDTPWIYKTKHSSGEYDLGKNVSSVISKGYSKAINESDKEIKYCMVLDADMEIDKYYVSSLVRLMDENEQLGVLSGGVYYESGGELVLESRHRDEPAGGATMFRCELLDELGGIPIVPCWDSAIKIKAKNRGYQCRYLHQMDSRAVQARPTGGKQDLYKSWFSKGEQHYILNYHPLVTILKFFNLGYSSGISGSIGYLHGYSSALFDRREKVEDSEIREYNWNVKKKDMLKHIK